MRVRHFLKVALLTGATLALVTPSRAQLADLAHGSGLPVPRYVSLKSDRVNVRKGPGFDYPIAWVYQRTGLPVEILKEFDNWRQVRDSDGSEGWVLQNLLSGRRTALVTPWEAKAGADGKLPVEPLREAGAETSAVVALIEPGVLATVLGCDKTWCRVTIAEQRGYIAQGKLWGVYRDEVVR